MNARVRKQAPGVQENALCYQAFFGKDAPCESCPMKRLLQSGGEALDASVLTEAQRAEVQVSIIQLGNTKGCMLSFHSKQDCQEADSVNPYCSRLSGGLSVKSCSSGTGMLLTFAL